MAVKVLRMSIALALCAAIVPVSAQAVIKNYELNIPRQSLDTALRAFANQTGLQVARFADTVDGSAMVGPLTGTYSTDEALRSLLEASGLTYKVVNDRTIAVTKPSEAASQSTETETKSEGAVESASPTAASGSSQLTFRLAQVGGSENSSSIQTTEKPSSGNGQTVIELEEIVVTGTHIRGSEAAGSKLIVIDRQAIAASGYGRVQDILETLTQNFASNGEEAASREVGSNNPMRGSEVQLRGLGTGSTLTLVNGQRQGLGGEWGNMVDISSIPTSAIERIEVLTEGASSLYGSDAIGGVVNIILRKDFRGFENHLRAGTAGGEADEKLIAQVWGGAWSKGSLMLGYQYNERDPLPAADREYSALNGDYRRYGGADWRTAGGNPATLVLNGQTYSIPTGQNGANLMQAQLIPGVVNYVDRVTYNQVLLGQEMHSGFLNASYDLTDALELSFSGRYATRDVEFFTSQPNQTLAVPAGNAFNRLGSAVSVVYDFTRDLGPEFDHGTAETLFTSLGARGELPGQWQINFGGAYAKERNIFHADNRLNPAAVAPYLSGSFSSSSATALNVFADGSNTSPATLAALLNFDYFSRTRWTTASVNAIADGPLFEAPGGEVRLAVGMDYRDEQLRYARNDRAATDPRKGSLTNPVDAARDVSAVFAELAVPLGTRLDLSLSGRYEDYSDFGTTLDPKVGLSWRPWDSIKLRGTWGTSFRAPPLWMSQVSSLDRSVSTVNDPGSPPANTATVLALVGPAPDMREEMADVWTAGVDIDALVVDGLSLSVTYFDIDYQGRIASPGFTGMLTEEALYAPLIIRNPTQAQINAICTDPNIVRHLGNCNQPIAAIVDARTRNLSILRTHGLDADLRYAFATSLGQWNVGVGGTYTFAIEKQIVDGAPVVDVVDTYLNPLALRLVGQISWERGGWTAQALLNYAGSYKASTAASAKKVASWTTANFNLGYRTEAARGWLSDTRFNLGIINVFDRDPPFVDNAPGAFNSVFGYDSTNANLLGRLISLQAIKAW